MEQDDNACISETLNALNSEETGSRDKFTRQSCTNLPPVVLLFCYTVKSTAKTASYYSDDGSSLVFLSHAIPPNLLRNFVILTVVNQPVLVGYCGVKI